MKTNKQELIECIQEVALLKSFEYTLPENEKKILKRIYAKINNYSTE